MFFFMSTMPFADFSKPLSIHCCINSPNRRTGFEISTGKMLFLPGVTLDLPLLTSER